MEKVRLEPLVEKVKRVIRRGVVEESDQLVLESLVEKWAWSAPVWFHEWSQGRESALLGDLRGLLREIRREQRILVQSGWLESEALAKVLSELVQSRQESKEDWQEYELLTGIRVVPLGSLEGASWHGSEEESEEESDL